MSSVRAGSGAAAKMPRSPLPLLWNLMSGWMLPPPLTSQSRSCWLAIVDTSGGYISEPAARRSCMVLFVGTHSDLNILYRHTTDMHEIATAVDRIVLPAYHSPCLGCPTENLKT